MSRLLLGAAARQRNALGSTAVATLYIGRVAASSDDAEEADTENIFLASLDLELAMDDAEGESIVGLRFTDVGLPRGGAINEAYLQFTAHSFGGTQVSVDIRAHAADDSATFTIEENDLSGRSLTSNSVAWDIPAWATGQVDEATTSPNLASVIREVINRPGWQPGNALTLIIARAADSPQAAANRRAAYSYDSDPEKAPQLFINQAPVFEEEEPEAPPPPTPTGFSSGGDAYGYLGVENFHLQGAATTSSTLKDGTTFTADMAAWYNALLYWVDTETYVTGLLDTDDSYNYGRNVRSGATAALQAFRFTGDLRLLDKALDFLDGMKLELKVGWDGASRNLYSGAQSGDPDPLYDESSWSPYPCWIYRESGGYDKMTTGTDLHMMNEPKTAAWIMEVAYACQLNAAYASPSGIANRYSDEANYWKAWLLDYQDKWQGSSHSGWRNNYRGLQYPSRHRADENTWPFCGKYGDIHTAVSNIPAMHYWWLLFGDAGALAARDRLLTKWREDELMPVTSSYGTAVVCTAGFRSEGSPTTKLLAAPYIGYVIADSATMFYTGCDENWGVTQMRQIMRSVADFMLNPDGSLKGDMYGEQNLSGFTNDSRGRSALQSVHVIYPYGLGIPFEDQSDNKISTRFIASHNSTSGGYNAKQPMVPAGCFIKGALQRIGAI